MTAPRPRANPCACCDGIGERRGRPCSACHGTGDEPRDPEAPARRGRPPDYAPLAGLDAAGLAAIVGASVEQARRYLAGTHDMGIVRLQRLLDHLRPRVDYVDLLEVVGEVAGRIEARRTRL